MTFSICIKSSSIALIVLVLTSILFSEKQISITIKSNDDIGPVNRFWRCTGHASGEYETDWHFPLNTMYIGGTPYNSLEYMRLHKLPYTVRASNVNSDSPTYDFSELDAIMDQFQENGLRPNFELMGGPQGMEWTDLDFISNESDRNKWKNFVKQIAQRYVDRYGVEEVRKWYWETENEPSPKSENGKINLAIKGQADEAGLHEVDDQLTYGGPGRSGGDNDYYVDFFLSFFHDSLNRFTGETGTRLDFVEWHSKGPYWWAVEDAKKKLDYIEQHCPRFKDNIRLVDDESDPVSGHGMPLGWRFPVPYAAMVANRIWACQTYVEEQYGGNYIFMNQDNAFVHGWPSRNLMCKFTDPNNDDHFEFIKKNINIYEMLSLLGDKHITADGYTSAPLPSGDDWVNDNNLGRVEAYATKDNDGRIAVLLFNNREYYIESTPDDATVTLNFQDLGFDQAKMVHYRIDETHTNPFRVWQEMGGPVDELSGELFTMVWDDSYYRQYISMQGPQKPTKEQFAQLRDRMELETLEDPSDITVSGGQFSIEIDLPCPSTSLIILAPQPAYGPGSPWNVRTKDFQDGITDERHTVVMWNEAPRKYIKTYKVLYSETENGTYERVNNADLFTTTFMHCTPSGSPAGYYKIQAVDYWDREGPAVGVGENVVNRKKSVLHTQRKTGLKINQFENTLQIRIKSLNDSQIFLFDSKGRPVLSESGFDNSYSESCINVQSLNSGIYYLKIRQNNNHFTHKIVVP